MKLEVHTYTSRGGRPVNEDAVGHFLTEDGGAFVLADGLGGHSHGEVASQTVVEALLDERREALKQGEALDAERLEAAFRAGNETLLRRQQSEGLGTMRTTAVVLSVQGEKALWGHVGDSRLYHFSGGDLAAVTADHSVSYKKYQAGEITRRQVHFDDDRSSLLQVMGNPGRCKPEILTQPVELSSGDAFLLCSDGFWEYLFQEELLVDLLKAGTAREWAELLLLRHIARARPGNDNYSFAAVLAR